MRQLRSRPAGHCQWSPKGEEGPCVTGRRAYASPAPPDSTDALRLVASRRSWSARHARLTARPYRSRPEMKSSRSPGDSLAPLARATARHSVVVLALRCGRPWRQARDHGPAPGLTAGRPVTRSCARSCGALRHRIRWVMGHLRYSDAMAAIAGGCERRSTIPPKRSTRSRRNLR